jgi:hypothetical protein
MGNYVGIFRLNASYAALDLGISEDTLIEYIEKFNAAGLVMYNAENETLWVIDHAEVQVGELRNGDKQIIAINKNVAAIERSAIRDEFFNMYHKQLKLSDELAPLQPVNNRFHASTHMNDALRTAETSRTALNTATGEGYLEGVLSALLVMRESDREAYCAADDTCVRENATFISKRFGARRATELILEAISSGDLGLTAAHDFVVACDI